MNDSIIAQPFAAQMDDGTLYDVIFEIAVHHHGPADEEAAYASLDDDYQALRKSVMEAIGLSGQGSILEPQDRAIAPYLFASILGSAIRSVAVSSATILAKISPNNVDGGDGRRALHGTLISQVLAEPLASRVREHPLAMENVIIHLNVDNTRAAARTTVIEELSMVKRRSPDSIFFSDSQTATHPYVFAKMTGYAIWALIDLDRSPATAPRGIYRVWQDAPVRALITDSVATVKADAAHAAFSASGKGVVWAVIDSGIDGSHPHFSHFNNLSSGKSGAVAHKDCTSGNAKPAASDRTQSGTQGASADDPSALEDPFGHGTHVAGIIAGAMSTDWTDETLPPIKDAPPPKQRPAAIVTTRNEVGVVETKRTELSAIAGMAPQCSLVSLRVLDEYGNGATSSIIDAIDVIQQWNDYGRNLTIHGVNLSIGCPFEAEWFACGQSPLCVEVDRLVESGVVVVVAAGNGGYGYLRTEGAGALSLGISMSISDPGNSELAITVGSTHRTAPHRYGVSYFSAKGPTGDGRLKPDLLGPGERIISCASVQTRHAQTVLENDSAPPTQIDAANYTYREDSGTSMAAPHVSGVVAAFLSIRREFIGRPREVKEIFMAAATDLRRDKNHQGAGLVDLMRAIQSV